MPISGGEIFQVDGKTVNLSTRLFGTRSSCTAGNAEIESFAKRNKYFACFGPGCCSSHYLSTPVSSIVSLSHGDFVIREKTSGITSQARRRTSMTAAQFPLDEI